MSMWLLTYVGAVFNGITLLILGKSQVLLPSPYKITSPNF